jgi:hypothetical protein
MMPFSLTEEEHVAQHESADGGGAYGGAAHYGYIR